MVANIPEIWSPFQFIPNTASIRLIGKYCTEELVAYCMMHIECHMYTMCG
jgi:hypothetical protein